MTPLYPFFFKPILKEVLWGGEVIAQKKNINTHQKLGESWEISPINQHLSIVSNGPLAGQNLNDLTHTYKEELLGHSVYSTYKSFPLLLKFIHTTKKLSLQVHPNDTLAKKENSFGKSECWYIIDHTPNASLTIGFKNKLNSKEDILNWIHSNQIEKHLNRLSVQKDYLYYIPSGNAHSIGADILLAEIQQASDITYRIHDWGHLDINGKKRELHIDKAMGALDVSLEPKIISHKEAYEKQIHLLNTPFFQVDTLYLRNEPFFFKYPNKNTFHAYMCTKGNLKLSSSHFSDIFLNEFQTILIPASINEFTLTPQTDKKTQLLHIYMK